MWIGCVGVIKRALAQGGNGGHTGMEGIGRSEERDPCVMVVVAVSVGEFAEPGTQMEQQSEAAGMVGLVIDGLEGALDEGERRPDTLQKSD